MRLGGGLGGDSRLPKEPRKKILAEAAARGVVLTDPVWDQHQPVMMLIRIPAGAAASLLTDYCVVEPAEPTPDAPAILLLHGFGAFGDQWRGNLKPLARKGYRVFAPTLPGFGRSEKAALQYSADVWRDFLR